jgi:hypothetical protein
MTRTLVVALYIFGACRGRGMHSLSVANAGEVTAQNEAGMRL